MEEVFSSQIGIGLDFEGRDLYFDPQFHHLRREGDDRYIVIFLDNPRSTLSYKDRALVLFAFQPLFQIPGLQRGRNGVALEHILDRERYVVLYRAINQDLDFRSQHDEKTRNTIDWALLIAHIDVETVQIDGAPGFRGHDLWQRRKSWYIIWRHPLTHPDTITNQWPYNEVVFISIAVCSRLMGDDDDDCPFQPFSSLVWVSNNLCTTTA